MRFTIARYKIVREFCGLEYSSPSGFHELSRFFIDMR